MWLIFAHCYWPPLQWNPLKTDCSSLPSTMGLNSFMFHILGVFFSLMLQTQVSLVTHHAHTIVIMNQPFTLLSSCSFFISKYFPIFLAWIETWLVPKYVASPAALSMVSCQTSRSLCFSGLRNAFLALKCNILTSVLTMRLCTILSLMLLALLFFMWPPGGSMGFTEDWFIDNDMTGDLNIFYK